MTKILNNLFSDNKWFKSNSKSYYNFKNIHKDSIKVINANNYDISKISNNASKGFEVWSKKTSKQRASTIKKIANLIKKNRIKLAQAEIRDTGKSLKQSLNEIDYCVKLWSHASYEALKIKDKIININKKTFCKITAEPVGLTALIVPWNFPLIVLSERLPYILSAGCSAIIKPSELASQSIISFIKCIKNSGIPKGVINLILGNGISTGASLIRSKDIKMISFTGSSDNGKIIMKNASKDLKRVSLELGGKNPFIIFDKKNLKQAVKSVVLSFTHNAGQACVGISKLYIKENIFKDFEKELENYFQYFSKFENPISNFNQYLKIYEFIKKLKINKNQIIYGSKPKQINKNNIFYPMIFKNLKKNNSLDHTEIFGPILNVQKFKNIEKLKKELNSNNYGLSCVIWCSNIRNSEKFINNLRYGRVWVNGNITQNYPQIPIGGFNWSGIGRETGKSSIYNYSEFRSTIINKIL